MGALGRVISVAAMLCIMPVKSEFLIEPVDKAFSIGSTAIVDCLANLTVKATCSWFHNSVLLNIDGSNYSLPKNGDKGDCQLNIAKFAIENAGAWKCQVNQDDSREVLLEAQAVPEPFKFKINETDVGAIRAVYLVPLDSIIVIEVTALNAYPKFLQEGSFFAYQDGTLLESEVQLEDSTKIQEANSLTATVRVQVDKKAVIKFVAKHRAYRGGQIDNNIVLRPNTEELPLTYRSYAGLVKTKVTVDPARESDVGLYRNTYKWHQLSETTNEWVTIGSPNRGLKLNALAIGSYTYKMSYEQDKPFKLTAESHPVHILIYEPLSDVAIKSPNDATISTTVGNTVLFECSANGYPEPRFYWIKVTKQGVQRVFQSQNLTVGNSMEDSGRYKCAAVQALIGQNVLRESKEVITLTVT